MAANRQEDFVFAEHVLSRGYATEEQIEECLKLLERLRGEMKLEESLANVLLKKGYLAPAQVQTIEHTLDPSKAGRPRNVIRGYQLQERIGSGAMGSVYKAHHLKLDLPVALKVLRASLSSSRTQIERLKREAQLAARLNHPNIVRGLDVGESTGFHYLAMEFVDGITVRDRIRKGPVPEKEALRIVRDVARALEHANLHGVIHRDVKPGNVMLTRDGRVKLADFGLARGKGPSDLTLEHASIGTPQYLAPEQAIRGANATHRSDLFSLGATLYHLVTGHPPFAGDNLGEIFQNVIHCRFAPPETVVKDLSLDTVYVIHHLMRAHPRERYASATALLADLERLEQGESIAPPHFKGDYQRYLRHRRARWMVFGGVVTAATIAVLVMLADWWSGHVQNVEHREFCMAANRRFENDLQRVATLAQLEELHGKLSKVPRAGCSDEEVPDLIQRTAKAASELSLVEKGEAQLAGAKQPNVVFRSLHAEAKRLQAGAYLPVTRERLKSIEKEIADLSRNALDGQRNRVRASATQEELLRELWALERGLRERYFDDEGEQPQVKAEADAVAELIEAWNAADQEHERTFTSAANLHDYRDANRTLSLWLDDLRSPLRKRQNLLSPASLALFKIPNDQRERLAEEERAYWRDSVEGPAIQALEGGKIDAAEDLVAPFVKLLAHGTLRDAGKLLDRIKARKKHTRAGQEAEILKLEARIGAALEGRRWLAPAELVAPEAAKTHWITEWSRRLKVLKERADVFQRLYTVFVGRAELHGIHRLEGDDPYLFVERLEEKERRLDLAELSHDELVQILALDKDDARDAPTREGCFYAAESFHDEDPRQRLDFVHKAMVILRQDDPWWADLRDRADALRGTVDSREQDANTYYDEMAAAAARKDYLVALSQCRRLLDDFKHTNFVAARREELQKLREEWDRRGGGIRARVRAGLPQGSFHFLEDPERGTTRLRFTFEEWFPDEDEAVPAHRKDKQAWKEAARKKHWRDRYRDLGVGWTDARYERSIRQLSWFSDALVADRQRGGAVLAGEPRDNWKEWWKGSEDQVRIITLKNPFRDPNNWSFECEVMWDAAPPKDDPERPRPSYPCYFALTAGDIQVGVVYYVDDKKGWDKTGKPKWPYGGGRGARIFRQASPVENLDKLFDDFLETRNKWKKPKKKKKRDHEFLPRWDKTVPYRMRLECKDGEVEFHLMPVDGPAVSALKWENHLLTHRFSRPDLEKAWMGKTGVKPFRIVSLVRCHLREVVIEGHR
ncbi:MAG: protein kinase domain-containing protein [Planctomycetota bacterium]